MRFKSVKRKRAYIPLPEKLAATLACLLPQEIRNNLRSQKVPASDVLALFQFDHIVLHSIGGSDTWENLDPKLVEIHREKSKRDTSIVAKAKRIDEKWNRFMVKIGSQKKGKKPTTWAKRKLQSRGFR